MANDLSLLSGLGSASLQQTNMAQQTKKLQELQDKAQEISKTRKNTPEDMEKAAQQFEGLLLKEMLKSMWQTVPDDGIFSGSKEESMYRDMLNDAYAEDLSSGQGIGIKELIIKEFQRQQ